MQIDPIVSFIYAYIHCKISCLDNNDFVPCSLGCLSVEMHFAYLTVESVLPQHFSVSLIFTERDMPE